jgi:hypothetical protein
MLNYHVKLSLYVFFLAKIILYLNNFGLILVQYFKQFVKVGYNPKISNIYLQEKTICIHLPSM